MSDERRSDQKNKEDRKTGQSQPPPNGNRPRCRIRRIGLFTEKLPAHHSSNGYYDDIGDGMVPEQKRDARNDGDRGALFVGGEVLCHSPDGEGNDRNGDDLESPQPAVRDEIIELGDSIGEQDQQGGGG